VAARAAGSRRATVSPAASATRVGAAPGAERLELVLPLAAHAAALRRFAIAVTTPGSPEYARYESIPRLGARFGASPATRRRVVRFLRAAGASGVRVDATGLFVAASLRAATAERLFRTTLARFATTRGAAFTAPQTPARIPRALRGLVKGVVGLDTEGVAVGAPVERSRAITRLGGGGASGGGATAGIAQDGYELPSGYSPVSGTQSGCAAARGTGGFTPNQYLTAYGYDPLHAEGLKGQGERVALIEIDGFRQSDIRAFARCFGLRLPHINAFGVQQVSRPLPPGGESTLDLEVLDAAAPRLKSIDVYESEADAADTLEALTAPLQNSGFKPQVISASLGLCEQFSDESVGSTGLATAEGSLEEAAASGITFLAASGDDGSADCTDAKGKPLPQLSVNYPASSWWDTAVGGTNFTLSAQNAISSQVVWNDAGLTRIPAAGGGGLSDAFKRPSYQDGTVAQDQRAVPDVAMLADILPGYAIYCSAPSECVDSAEPDPWQTVGGTSAGTPLLAGGFALVDQLLRRHRRQDLGLANPLLYELGRNATDAASVFGDVTAGSNDVGPFIGGFDSPLGCCAAATGFDEASGWGAVDLAQFAAAAVSSQPAIVDVGMRLPGGQHPVRHRRILARVMCSGRCVFGAIARVTIHGQRPFTAYSGLYHLPGAGHRTVTIPFTRVQLRKLHAGLAQHRRIVAVVAGAIVDAGGNIERESSKRDLKIAS
jgi:subtilase family serine protease